MLSKYILIFFIGLLSGALPGIILYIIHSTQIKKLSGLRTEIIKNVLREGQNGN